MITLLICSATMSALALLYMAATPLLSKRYSDKGRYYAWIVIVIGLIIPFRPQWSSPLVSVEVPGYASSFIAEVSIATQNPQTIPINMPYINNVVASNVISSISWWQFTAIIWFVGVVVLFAYHIIKHARFTKLVRRWSEPAKDMRIVSLFKKLKSEMGIEKQIPLYICPSVNSPMLIGVFKPKILLPTTDMEQDELNFVLKHELVHYKRKDLLYKHLVVLATILHWFNPIVYLIARMIDELCEKSCDTEVIQFEDADARQSYGETIIGVARYQSKMKTALSTGFYNNKKSIKSRIATIMDSRKKKPGLILACVAMFLTLSVGYVLTTSPTVGATEPTEVADEWAQVMSMFSEVHQIDDLPIPNYLPENFVIEQVWFYPPIAEVNDETSSESIRSAMYIRVGNGTQSFDIEIVRLSEQENVNVFDAWMLVSLETTINGRRAFRGPGWLSIEINQNVRYSFMWGAFDPQLADPPDDEILVRIAESIRLTSEA